MVSTVSTRAIRAGVSGLNLRLSPLVGVAARIGQAAGSPIAAPFMFSAVRDVPGVNGGARFSSTGNAKTHASAAVSVIARFVIDGYDLTEHNETTGVPGLLTKLKLHTSPDTAERLRIKLVDALKKGMEHNVDGLNNVLHVNGEVDHYRARRIADKFIEEIRGGGGLLTEPLVPGVAEVSHVSEAIKYTEKGSSQRHFEWFHAHYAAKDNESRMDGKPRLGTVGSPVGIALRPVITRPTILMSDVKERTDATTARQPKPFDPTKKTPHQVKCDQTARIALNRTISKIFQVEALDNKHKDLVEELVDELSPILAAKLPVANYNFWQISDLAFRINAALVEDMNIMRGNRIVPTFSLDGSNSIEAVRCDLGTAIAGRQNGMHIVSGNTWESVIDKWKEGQGMASGAGFANMVSGTRQSERAI